MKRIKVPTGDICIIQGQKGLLEFLSIGDYGKEKNIKADFMGLTNEINGVPNGDIMPLSEKWVVTISTQYGCSMGCKFCDVPLVGKGVNATLSDLMGQVTHAIRLHPEVDRTKRLNIHFARMGEPTFNFAVLDAAVKFKGKQMSTFLSADVVHPVVSTMMPRLNSRLTEFLDEWIYLKNGLYEGDAGLQLSINSTDEEQRADMFSGSALSLAMVSSIAYKFDPPKGRKYTLNFALASGYEVDAHKLSYMFDPEKFMVKITPIHETHTGSNNGIRTDGGYTSYSPYQKVEEELKKEGFDVIVFVPSYDEDKGMITCGNAILSGNMPTTKYEVIDE